MRVIKISKCEDCPYFEYAYTNDPNLYVCEHMARYREIIIDKYTIQDFCPLKEVK